MINVSSSKKPTKVSVQSLTLFKNHMTRRNPINHLPVSTELCLQDPTWPAAARYHSRRKMCGNEVAYRIGLMRHYRPEEEEEEEQRRLGIYPWKITKTLTPSDLGGLSRLLMTTSIVQEHILPFLDDDGRTAVDTERGLEVTVWDFDTNSCHQLVFKKWHTAQSYVFIRHWTRDFVRRRQLNVGDVIGMYWDLNYSRFHFCVLNRTGPRIEEAAAASPACQ